MLTTVMYHYVRPRPGPGEPRLNARWLDEFDGQLAFLASRYSVVGQAEVVDAVQGRGRLRPDACLLTFDDGFRDHLRYVAPRLADRGWRGSFYVPAGVLGGRVLDVHRIHFILAAGIEPSRLAREVFEHLRPFRESHGLPSEAELIARYQKPNRYDPPEINLVKRVLQRGIPAPVRGEITGLLFRRYVTEDEAGLAGELYMDETDLRSLVDAGMDLGGHGSTHQWFDSLTDQEQAEEVRATVSFLTRILGRPPVDWTMSYPYNSGTPLAQELLRRAGCALAFTTEPGTMSESSNLMALPRLDTNDVPIAPDAGEPDIGRPARRASLRKES